MTTFRAANQRVLLWTASIWMPVVVMSGYLAFSRWPQRWFTTSSDYAALTVAVVVGVACVWLIPTRWQWRLALSIANIAVMSVGLFWWSFAFVCIVFEDCL